MNYWARETGLQELFVAVQQSRYDVLNAAVFSLVGHPIRAEYRADKRPSQPRRGFCANTAV
jgi:hypothetical protein